MRWFKVWAESASGCVVVSIQSHSQAMALLWALDELEEGERVLRVEEVTGC